MRSCRLARNGPSVRMLCSRSASLTMMTRMSVTIASSILRMLSACRSSRECRFSLPILVTPSTQRATSIAEALVDFLDGDAGVFYDVVEEAGLERYEVELHLRQNQGYVDRVAYVRFAGIASLAFVVFSRKGVSLTKWGEVFTGTERSDF